MEAQVKYFMLYRMPLLLLGIGGALLLTPACKAQSEISPDHFDGTDSWAAAAETVHAPVQKQAVAKTALQAKSQKATQGAAFQLAASREASKPVSSAAAAADRKQTAPAGNPPKQ